MSVNEECLPEIAINADEYARLESLLNNTAEANLSAVEYLERELSRAQIIEPGDHAPDTVHMHSTVTFVDQQTKEERTATLVYPHEANISENKISILSPIGAALIGMYAGEQITWYTPNQQRRNLKVLRIEHCG